MHLNYRDVSLNFCHRGFLFFNSCELQGIKESLAISPPLSKFCYLNVA